MNKKGKTNTILILGSFLILGLITVSNLIIIQDIIPIPTPECPFQNDYWVVVDGVINKTIQSKLIVFNKQEMIVFNLEIDWYTDYTGIAEPITRGEMKDWHIQTNIDVRAEPSGYLNRDVDLIMRIYHSSNNYPEVITLRSYWGNTPNAYFTICLDGQTSTVLFNQDTQTLNLGNTNSFNITAIYYEPE